MNKLSIEDLDVNQAASLLAADPIACCRKLNPFTSEPRIMFWNWPLDGRRPPGRITGFFINIATGRPADKPALAGSINGMS